VSANPIDRNAIDSNALEKDKTSLAGKCKNLSENATEDISAEPKADLLKIIGAWPNLSPEIRSAILLLALTAG